MSDCQFCSHLTYNKEEKYYECPFPEYEPCEECKNFVKGDKDNFAHKEKSINDYLEESKRISEAEALDLAKKALPKLDKALEKEREFERLSQS